MQVILQEKIKNLGAIGEIVDVKPGYARNFLYRTGKALPANKQNIAEVMARKNELEKIEQKRLAEAKKRVVQIEKIGKITISVPTNEEGKLFGSVGAAEIVTALLEHGIEAVKQEVSIVEVPVRSVGEYTVQIHAHADAIAEIKLVLNSSTVTELFDVMKKDSEPQDNADSKSSDEGQTQVNDESDNATVDADAEAK